MRIMVVPARTAGPRSPDMPSERTGRSRRSASDAVAVKAAGEAFARLRGNPEYCTLYAAGGPASDPVRLLDESTVTLHQVLLEADPLYEAALVVAWRGERVAVLRTLLDLTSETAAQVAGPDREGGGVPQAPLDAERTPHDCLAVLMADGVPFVKEEWSCPAED